MLQIKHSDKIVIPMRPDAPNTFGSEDVPHGTDSCIYKAAKVLNSQGANIALPKFTDEEIAAMVDAKKAEVSMLPLVDSEGNKISYDMTNISNLEFIEPTEEDVKKEFYSNYPLRDKFKEVEVEEENEDGEIVKVMTMVEVELEPKMKTSETGEEVQLYVDLDDCKAKLIETKKQQLAEQVVNHRIEQCLDVPVLSQEFKDQFQSIENVESEF